MRRMKYNFLFFIIWASYREIELFEFIQNVLKSNSQTNTQLFDVRTRGIINILLFTIQYSI